MNKLNVNRFTKYDKYMPKNDYWGILNLENDEDKLLLLIERFFIALDKETKVNDFEQINDRVVPLNDTFVYLKLLFDQIKTQQNILEKENIANLCRVYSLFIINREIDDKKKISFPIIIPTDFEDNSFACSITFLLIKYCLKKRYLDLNEVEKVEFENHLNSDNSIFNLERETPLNLITDVKLIIRKNLSSLIEWFAEKEKIDTNKLVHFFLKTEGRKFLDLTLGMDFLNNTLKDEKNKNLLDYYITVDTPMLIYYIQETKTSSELIREMLSKLPEGLFEKDYFCYQKYKDKSERILDRMPDFYNMYREEQLKKKLLGSENLRIKIKI